MQISPHFWIQSWFLLRKLINLYNEICLQSISNENRKKTFKKTVRSNDLILRWALRNWIERLWIESRALNSWKSAKKLTKLPKIDQPSIYYSSQTHQSEPAFEIKMKKSHFQLPDAFFRNEGRKFFSAGWTRARNVITVWCLNFIDHIKAVKLTE